MSNDYLVISLPPIPGPDTRRKNVYPILVLVFSYQYLISIDRLSVRYQYRYANEGSIGIGTNFRLGICSLAKFACVEVRGGIILKGSMPSHGPYRVL